MATLIEVSGAERHVEPRDGKKFSLSEAQALVGGYVEMLTISKHQRLLVDEEGRLKPEVQLNLPASLKFNRVLLGPVLLIHRKEF